jgi:segregation and condensation protein B
VEKSELVRVIESLLFVSGEPLELTRLQQVLGVEREEVEAALEMLATQCLERGVRLQRHGATFQLVSAPEVTPYVEKLLGVQNGGKLSPAAVETLAIIAYEQPVTRARIEAVRGVNCDRSLATLLTRGLVCEVGKLETVGHPSLFGTTIEFLQYFGLESLNHLPTAPSIEQLKQQTAVIGENTAN